MSYMLDTCSFIWYIETSNRLPAGVRELIDTAEDIYISMATLWEIAIKQTTGKLDLDLTIFELDEKCKENKITILPIELRYLEKIKKLPLIHKDPFDRIIIASAVEEDLIILTCDNKIMNYPDVKTLWELPKEEK